MPAVAQLSGTCSACIRHPATAASPFVIPAQAEIHLLPFPHAPDVALSNLERWISACAGMTENAYLDGMNASSFQGHSAFRPADAQGHRCRNTFGMAPKERRLWRLQTAVPKMAAFSHLRSRHLVLIRT